MKASDFFTFPDSLRPFAAHFSGDLPPWEWLKRIGPALEAFRFGPNPAVPPGVHLEGSVHLDPSVVLPPYAVILGPVWIGPGTRLGPGAFLRGPLIVGARGVLGNAGEFKNCLFLDDVAVPHHPYVGDSVLGNGAHLGAGAVCSNLRLDRGLVSVRGPDAAHETGLRKVGALIGDGAEVGCNAVLNPGSLLGRRSLVAPSISFSGYLPADTLARVRHSFAHVARRA
jgi:bifunctional N-acetylglucosamine-1-phosphate-uridyltransferase/glucosamine-1-phosphate-acetyltransferase GlmU-like protein